MTTLEIHLDDEIAERARQQAAARGKSLEALVLDHIREVATPCAPNSEGRRAMVQRLKDIGDRAGAEVGPITWTREDTHER